MKKPKKILRILSESHVREFREKSDSAEYLDWSKTNAVTFPNSGVTKTSTRRGRGRKRARTGSLTN
jgi:hypothetical protein